MSDGIVSAQTHFSMTDAEILATQTLRQQQEDERLAEAFEAFSEAALPLWAFGDGDGGAVLDKLREFMHRKYPETAPNCQPQSAGRKTIKASLRTAVYERDGYKCLHCGVQKDLTLDHVYPHSMGGGDTFKNLQTLCGTCNARKGDSI